MAFYLRLLLLSGEYVIYMLDKATSQEKELKAEIKRLRGEAEILWAELQKE